MTFAALAAVLASWPALPAAATPGWTMRTMPSRTGIELPGLACPAIDTCYAVGWSSSGPMAERWDGTSWSIQSTPGPTGLQLLAISCSAVSACTAVGTDSSLGTPVAERWDGSSWSVQSLPYWTGQLGSVSCVSDTSCMAVGYQVTGRITTAVAASWSGS
jgi:hypothetical protein